MCGQNVEGGQRCKCNLHRGPCKLSAAYRNASMYLTKLYNSLCRYFYVLMQQTVFKTVRLIE